MLVYTCRMKKTLLATNPHLKDAAQRERALARNIESSSAIEGILVKRHAVSGQFVTTESSSARTGLKKKDR